MLSILSVYLFLAGLLVAPFTILSAAPAYADTPDNTPFITWNMQGANAGGTSLWTTYIPQLLSNNSADVIMLQEAGAAPPASATLQGNPTGDPRVSIWTWNRGTSTRPDTWYLYFLQSSNPQVPGGRVNTMVLSRTQADSVLVVDNPFLNAPGRPAIGIRLGNDFYFSYHALSGGGGDAVRMLTAIGRAVANSQPAGVTYNWTGRCGLQH